jgi:flavin reductase (DIM6/NTAB) family NADH-FMN oxidoreductase RutF
VAPVTLWTATGPAGPAGLTVSSMLVADGDPGRMLGLVDDESDLWEALSAAGRFAVCPLHAGQRQLADRFAGLAPAPGGRFAHDRWQETGYGPVPADHPTWVGCRLDHARPFGWGLLVEATVAEVVIAADEVDPLSHYRGRYRALSQ